MSDLIIQRNKDRFPEDFMFQLTDNEYENLRSQIVTSRPGGRRYMPFVFTEHGAVMLATVLRSTTDKEFKKVWNAIDKFRNHLITLQGSRLDLGLNSMELHNHGALRT